MALYAGSILHILLDLLKTFLGRGSIFPLHPFSTQGFEIGLYRSEDVFYILPANVGILAILWVLARRKVSPPPPHVTEP
jgi:hypothetical protein